MESLMPRVVLEELQRPLETSSGAKELLHLMTLTTTLLNKLWLLQGSVTTHLYQYQEHYGTQLCHSSCRSTATSHSIIYTIYHQHANHLHYLRINQDIFRTTTTTTTTKATCIGPTKISNMLQSVSTLECSKEECREVSRF